MNFSRFFRVLLLHALGSTLVSAQSASDPRITAWLTMNSAKYARVYETAADRSSGNAVTIWPRAGLTNGGGGQATPAYSEIQRVVYSTNYVYITTSGLPGYTMGHWLTPNGGVYTSWPTNRGAIHRIPRSPTIPTTKQKTNGSGGVLVNGVFVWANGDAQSYNTSTGIVSMQGGQGIWNRLAGVAEAFNFDSAYGHQPNNGAYHNHVNPIALRYQLGDNVTYNATAKTYSEAATITKHSPLIGWANDGLPIYGPYGYASAMDSGSGLRRMTSGFQKRNGTNGTTNLAVTGRTTLPKWAAEVQGKSQTLAANEYGPSTTATYQVAPSVTGTYTLGIFAEDYEYLGDVGKVQGTDFDLNRQNVRYCVTPEFPGGTYAYFVAIDASGATVFPDIINQEYFGTAPMGQGTVTSINETVTEHVRGGPAATIAVTAAMAGGGVALTWNSAEGATYRVESSADESSWTTVASAVTSAGASTSYTAPAPAAYFRVTLTAIATYDTKAVTGTPVGQSGTVSYGATSTGTAPTITTQPSNATVVVGGNATFSVGASGTAPLSYQWNRGGNAVAGATGATLVLTAVQTSDAGSYTCTVTNAAGSVTSAAATLSVTSASAGTGPTITTQPTGVTAAVGGSAAFMVTATGTGPLSYQWYRGTTAVAQGTAATLTLSPVQTTHAGIYTVVVSNSAGNVTSAAAALNVTGTSAGMSPTIVGQPADVTVAAGGAASFSVSVTGAAPLTYQWRKDGAAIAGATGASLGLANVGATDAGSYSVVVTNAAGNAVSQPARLTIGAPSFAGTYLGTLSGGLFALQVRTDNTAAFFGYGLSGLTIVARTVAVDANGRLRFTTQQSTAASAGRAAATVEVTVDATLTANGVAGTITGAGETVTMSGSKAAATGATAAWTGVYESGAAGAIVAGYTVVAADGRAFVMTVTPAGADAGVGTVDASGRLSVTTQRGATVTGAMGSGGTLAATVAQASGGTVALAGGSEARAPTERLSNLSTRASTAGSALIVGFVVGGDAAKSMLIRAVGPALEQFGVQGPLTAARLEIYRGTTLIASGEQWAARPGGDVAAIVEAATRVGAFALPSSSRDAALLLSLAPGDYSAVVSGVGGATGVALVEVYDAATAVVARQRLVNLATRARAGAGDSTLIAGFVIAGEVPKRVLVRGVGPALAPFGVMDAMADPELRIQIGSMVVAANNDWGQDAANATAIAAAAAQVGAFALSSGSRDAAVLLYLAPGAYTAQVGGVGGAAGTALVEVYEVP